MMRGNESVLGQPRVRASVLLSVSDGTKKLARRFGREPPPDPIAPDIDPYAWVPLADYLHYLEDAAYALAMPQLGLELGTHFEVTGLGPLGLVFMSSATSFDALIQLKIFLQAWQEDTDVVVDSDAHFCSWTYRIRTPALRLLRRQDALLSLSVVTTWLRARLGAHWNPAEVHFEQPPPSDQIELKRFFRSPLYFSQPANGLLMDRLEGDRRARDQVQPFVPFMQRHLRDLMEAPVDSTDIVETVSNEVARRLGIAPVTHEAIAHAVGLSCRTLQRRLAAANSGLRRIVEAERLAVMQDVLRSDGKPGRLARELGYADAATACRAVKRWTGRTPSMIALDTQSKRPDEN